MSKTVIWQLARPALAGENDDPMTAHLIASPGLDRPHVAGLAAHAFASTKIDRARFHAGTLIPKMRQADSNDWKPVCLVIDHDPQLQVVVAQVLANTLQRHDAA